MARTIKSTDSRGKRDARRRDQQRRNLRKTTRG